MLFKLSRARTRWALLLGATLCLVPVVLRGAAQRSQTPRPAAKRLQQFALALPGYGFAFPRDHGSHAPYATEWWYYTGHLKAQNGRRLGFQVTWFRVALAPSLPRRASKWAARDLIFGHLALSDEAGRRFLFTDRISRAALDLAGADRAGTSSPRVWLGPWKLRFSGLQGEAQTLSAGGKAEDGTPFSLALRLRSALPPSVHGERGVSQKAAGVGRASHYYSYCRLNTSGLVKVGSERFAVTGQSWFDHEFGSNQLAANQRGWDWFAVQLADGRALMLYRMRLQNGQNDPFSSGTLVERDGQMRHLKLADFRIRATGTWHSARSGATYPARWTLEVPRLKLSLDVTPTLSEQELDTRRSSGVTYWEGDCRVTGAQNGQTLRGNAYVELTGYAQGFAGSF